jgi:hypothetical protein
VLESEGLSHQQKRAQVGNDHAKQQQKKAFELDGRSIELCALE